MRALDQAEMELARTSEALALSKGRLEELETELMRLRGELEERSRRFEERERFWRKRLDEAEGWNRVLIGALVGAGGISVGLFVGLLLK